MAKPSVIIEAAPVTIASGASTAVTDDTAQHKLPEEGVLIAASIVAQVASTPPVWCVLSVGRANQALRLTKGWVRGSSVYSHDGGIEWHGEFRLSKAPTPFLFAFIRNDTGSEVTVVVEWAVEDLPGSSHEENTEEVSDDSGLA